MVLISHNLILGQQNIGFSQITYNTMNVNPAYTGSKGYWSAIGMHRSQWVGVNGSPTTQNLSIDGPMGNEVGLGINLTNDALGPVNELFLNLNFSYTLKIDSDDKKLSFGLKGGGRLFNVDFTKGITEFQDITFQTNIENKFFPTIGAGMYYRSPKSYFGVSIPNFFSQQFYDASEQELDVDRLHFLIIGGSVITLNKNVLLKPAVLVKWLPDEEVLADVSLSALIKETLTVGLSYRLKNSISALAGIQISPRLHAGYAYDMTTKNLKSYSFGTHEIFLRFDLKSEKQTFKSKRFF